MDNVLYSTDPIVRDRLRIIIASEKVPCIKNLVVVNPAFDLPSSIIFNALYWDENNGCFKDVFTEISRRRIGFSPIRDAFSVVKGIRGMPSLEFYMTADGIVFGLTYDFPVCALPYDLFFYYHKDRKLVFLRALKEMIFSVHTRGFLLPTNWRSEDGLLYADREGLPIFITYNGVRSCDSKEKLSFGFLQDWQALRVLIDQSEKGCEQHEQDSFCELRDDIDGIIGKLKK